MSVELRELRYFVVVAQELSFTRAAARLHLAQQTLSSSIRQLEVRLGAELFRRTTRRVELTDAGEALLPHARKAIAAAEAGEEAAAQVAAGVRGRLRVGLAATGAIGLTPQILRAFGERYPSVTATVRHFPFDDPSGGVCPGESDVGIVRPPFEDHGIEMAELFAEPRWLALSARHPLATRDIVCFADIEDETWVDSDTDDRWCAFWSCDELRREPVRRGPSCQSYEEMFDVVRTGAAVGLVPESVARHQAWPDLAYVPVADIAPSLVCVAWRSEQPTPATRNFVTVAQDVAAGYGERRLAVAG